LLPEPSERVQSSLGVLQTGGRICKVSSGTYTINGNVNCTSTQREGPYGGGAREGVSKGNAEEKKGGGAYRPGNALAWGNLSLQRQVRGPGTGRQNTCQKRWKKSQFARTQKKRGVETRGVVKGRGIEHHLLSTIGGGGALKELWPPRKGRGSQKGANVENRQGRCIVLTRLEKKELDQTPI